MSKSGKNFSLLKLVSKCKNLGATVIDIEKCGNENDSWLVLSLTIRFSNLANYEPHLLVDLIMEYGRPTGSLPDFDMHSDSKRKCFYVFFPLKDYEL